MKPTNYTTEKEYTGGNIFLLLDTPFTDQRWATYKQWKNAGFQVQKGQKGVRLTKIVSIDDKKTGEPKKVPRGFTVFNIDQVKEIQATEKVA